MAEPLQIESVTETLPATELWGSFKVLGVEGNRLELFGWALGKSTEVKKIEVLVGGSVVASTTPTLPREDLAELHPDRASAATCGFKVVIEARGKGKSELKLRAVLDDGTPVSIGAVHVAAPSRRWELFRRR